MPANTTQEHHRHHHDGIFNPNPNPNSNSNSNPQKPSRKFLFLLLKATIMAIIAFLFFLFLGIAAAAFLQFFLLHHRSSSSSSSTENLPRQKYASGSAASVKEDCAVCLEAFRDDEWCRSLPKCFHLFHAGCVDRWLTKVANCPVCRAPVKLDSGASGSVIGDNECKLLWAVGV